MFYARALFGGSPRPLTLLVALVVGFVLLVPGGAGSGRHSPWASPRAKAAGRWHFKGMERCFMKKINHRRAHHGRRKLDSDKQLGYVARRHAKREARSAGIYHDDRLAAEVTHWRALGQNTGEGFGCKSLFHAFWYSSVHRANILGQWRHFAVGTKWRHGVLYVQQVFEARHNPGNVWHSP